MLTSHLKLPSCILASNSKIFTWVKFFRYKTASSALLLSGSDTISNSGVPALFKSTCETLPAWTFFPASFS